MSALISILFLGIERHFSGYNVECPVLIEQASAQRGFYVGVTCETVDATPEKPRRLISALRSSYFETQILRIL